MTLNDILPYCQHQLYAPYLRKLSIGIMIIQYCNSITTLIYFCFNWDPNLAVNIGYCQVVSLFSAFVTAVGLSTANAHHAAIKIKETMWSFDEAGPEVSKRISGIIKVIQKLRIIVIIISLFTFVFFLPIRGDYREFFILTFIIEDKVNKTMFQIVLVSFSTFLIIYNDLIFINVCFIALTTTREVICHILLIREKLKSIQETYGNAEILYYNEGYQMFVDDLLKKCSREYLSTLRYGVIVKREVEKGMIFGSMVGVVCLAFCYYTTKMNLDIKVSLKCVLLQGISLIHAILFAEAGQSLMDEGEALHRDLCECPWIVWNKSNKSTYLIMLISTKEPIKFTRLNYTLNHNVLVICYVKDHKRNSFTLNSFQDLSGSCLEFLPFKPLLGAFLHEVLPYAGHQIEIPFLRKVTFIVLIGLFFNSISTVVYFNYNWDISLAISVGYSQVIDLFATVNCLAGLSSTSIHYPIIELKKELWSFDELGIEISSVISERYRQLRRTRIIVALSTGFVVTTCLPLSGNYREFFILSYIIEQIVNETLFQYMLITTAASLALYCGILFINVTFTTLWGILEIGNYILLVREKLKLIEKIHGNETNCFYDEAYQKFVDDTLRKCIFQHILILRFGKLLKKVVEKFVIFNSLIGIACLSFLYLETKKNMDMKVLVKSVFLQGVSLTFVYLYCKWGQVLIDECGKLHSVLCECPWYLWNKSNKLSYLNFLMMAQKPITFTSLDITLNLNFLVVIARKSASLFTAVEKMSALN